jgi:hypothetical protein
MSQDITSKPEASGQFYTNKSMETWSVESDADRLMDELFSDIDRMLEGGAKLKSESVQPNYVSLQSVVVPAVVMPKIKPQGGSLVHQSVESTSQEKRPQATFKAETKSQKNSHLDLILFGVASLGLLGAIAWLVTTGKLTIPSQINFLPNLTESSSEPLSETDYQFVAYLQRSLELIDRKQELNQDQETPPSNQASVTLPPAPAPANTGSNPQPQSSVIERIYIPVYPPAQETQPVQPVTPVQPVQPVQPVTPPTPTAALPAPPSIAVPSPPSLNSSATSPSPSDNNLDSALNLPVVKHTLVGLLESGENSAALFEIDGSSIGLELVNLLVVAVGF